VSNVKSLLPVYMIAEQAIKALIYERFRVGKHDDDEIRRVDYGLMAHEARILMNNVDHFTFPEHALTHQVKYESWRNVEIAFLSSFFNIMISSHRDWRR
jgi:predicted subunit of tRNA(5-methylaminomethyl-2-thiouridylate) methyltransferase